MNRIFFRPLGITLLCAAFLGGASSKAAAPNENVSLRNEVQHAIDNGLNWLQKNQSATGTWSNTNDPAVTAIVLTAFNGEPDGHFQKNPPEFMKKGYGFLLNCVQSDGSIYNKKELVNYNTSIAMMAFITSKNPEYRKTILNARRYLVGTQIDEGKPGKVDTAFDGGIGYGDHYTHSDLSNTTLAMEALYYSKDMAKDSSDAKDLNWKAAIHFLQNCQNLPAYNKESWVTDDPQNKGGFIYFPGESKAGETNINGRVAYRSYGSASYAGLLTYIYADLKRDDPRVQGVVNWLQNNYTLDENPGMGPQGIYYYYHTMAKALTIYGADTFATKDGKKVNWREQLAMKLINLQKADGSWANENGRWWEKDPALVTAYSVIALELIHRGL